MSSFLSYTKHSIILVLWFSFATLFGIVIASLLQVWNIIPINLGEIYPRHFFILVSLEAIIFIVLFQYFLNQEKIKIPFQSKKANLKDIIYLAIGYFTILILSSLINIALGVEDIQMADYNKNNIQSEAFLFFIVTVIIAPLYEEYIFRGVLLGSFILKDGDHQKIGNLKDCISLIFSNHKYIFALVFSSGLFAIVHGYIQLIPAISMIGLYLGIVFIYFGSLKYCIIIHAFHNCLAFLVYVGV